MADLAFDIAWEQCECADPLEAATYGSLAIRIGAMAITEVRDDAARTTREVVRVSAYPLALWLASGWWRLRWEGHRQGGDWRLSHQLGGAGGGYVWPDVTFESDGESIHVDVRRRSQSMWEPIAYLNDVRTTITATDFEVQVGDFVDKVLARLAESGHSGSPLSRIWATVRSESRNPREAASRRLEAMLGFDAEEAPGGLLDEYARGARSFGEDAVAELAAVATNGIAPDWGAMSAALDSGARIHIDDYAQSKAQATLAVQQLPSGAYPWERGEAAARALRKALGMPRGPLSNETLGQWLGADLSAADSATTGVAIARRERPEVPDLTVCYRSSYPDGRRFELARLLGDHFIAASAEDRLLPATRARTARQSVQRAFAAELLVPWDDLAERIGDTPDIETMEATARAFEVSALVVRTRLVTKGVLPSDALDRG